MSWVSPQIVCSNQIIAKGSQTPILDRPEYEQYIQVLSSSIQEFYTRNNTSLERQKIKIQALRDSWKLEDRK